MRVSRELTRHEAERQADRLSWDTRWDRVLDWDDPPFAKWFVGGKLKGAITSFKSLFVAA